jgi:hypothetical protein
MHEMGLAKGDIGLGVWQCWSCPHRVLLRTEDPFKVRVLKAGANVGHHGRYGEHEGTRITSVTVRPTS